MTALEECHAKGFLWKAMGNCSEIKHRVNMCLRAERLERTAENREKAKAKKAKIDKIFAEIDANS
jgi:COX assembly protein 2